MDIGTAVTGVGIATQTIIVPAPGIPAGSTVILEVAAVQGDPRRDSSSACLNASCTQSAASA
jgi:hypothetical protein